MEKVIVIGCPGSGKSTFSRSLQQRTRLPLYPLDTLYWNSDGSTVSRAVFLSRLRSAMAGERWILDGNYASTMELRMASCDTVIFLDYPTELCLAGIRERKGKPRPDMPWAGAGEAEDREFLAFVENYALESRPAVLALLEKYADRSIFRFHTRQESELFLRRAPWAEAD